MKRIVSRESSDISPDSYLAQPSVGPSSPNTSRAHAEESILNASPLLVSQDSPPPLNLPSSSPVPPSLLPLPPSPLSSPLSPSLSLSLPPPSPSAPRPSQPLEETHDTVPPPQVTYERGTMRILLYSINSSLDSLHTKFCGTIGGLVASFYDNRPSYHTLLCFALWLMHWVEAGNAYLEVRLGRHARALLIGVFTLHPLLIRVYLIVELALLSLHPAALLLTCLLYIQEAILLATELIIVA